jgi:[ribosomal protein S5]-alanine N-acetyltransferase
MRRIARRGGRVYLRAARRADRDEFLRLDRASRRFYRGRVMPPVTARQWSAYLARRRRPDSPGYLICRTSDDALVGGININEIVRGVFRSGYLGYQIGPLRLHRVEANIQPGNRGSIALVRRAGFRREGLSRRYLKIGGRWRDHERWALTVEEWRGRRRPRRTGKPGRRPSA